METRKGRQVEFIGQPKSKGMRNHLQKSGYSTHLAFEGLGFCLGSANNYSTNQNIHRNRIQAAIFKKSRKKRFIEIQSNSDCLGMLMSVYVGSSREEVGIVFS